MTIGNDHFWNRMKILFLMIILIMSAAMLTACRGAGTQTEKTGAEEPGTESSGAEKAGTEKTGCPVGYPVRFRWIIYASAVFFPAAFRHSRTPPRPFRLGRRCRLSVCFIPCNPGTAWSGRQTARRPARIRPRSSARSPARPGRCRPRRCPAR